MMEVFDGDIIEKGTGDLHMKGVVCVTSPGLCRIKWLRWSDWNITRAKSGNFKNLYEKLSS